jgi:hypothetical protein
MSGVENFHLVDIIYDTEGSDEIGGTTKNLDV